MSTRQERIAAAWDHIDDVIKRVEIFPVEPLEGTSISLWNSILPTWYAEQASSIGFGDQRLAERTWAASRCQDLNAQQISAMKIHWYGPPGTDEPAWVSSPDPSSFPNGIGNVMYALTDQLYGYGYALLYITDLYANGYPRRFTLLSSAACVPRFDDEGRKVYKVGSQTLDPRSVVQIDRNPTTAAHGTSALYAYARPAESLVAAGNKSLSVSQDAFPPGYLSAEQRLTSEQADSAATSWMSKTSARAGGVPVLGQGWEFKNSGLNPADMALLETQDWDARVICSAYGVPSLALNIPMTGGLTYQNPEALFRMWWLTELRPKAKMIMEAFSANLLPAGQYVTVDASDITTEGSVESDDDTQQSPVAKASPAQRPLTAIGGTG